MIKSATLQSNSNKGQTGAIHDVSVSKWSQDCAKLISSLHQKNFPRALVSFVNEAVSNEECIILAFSGNDQPVALYDNIQEGEELFQIEAYLSGPYLLDPFYMAFSNDRLTGAHLLKDLAPDEFRKTEYYNRYYKRIGIVDEAGLLIDIDKNTCIHISISRRSAGNHFSDDEFFTLRAISPVIISAVRQHWSDLSKSAEDPSSPGNHLHHQLRDAYDNFGSSILTSREVEIVKLMMRGHSAKSAARIMKISPGTVMNHRRNVYAKLKINSQSELFNLFLESLALSAENNEADPLAKYQLHSGAT